MPSQPHITSHLHINAEIQQPKIVVLSGAFSVGKSTLLHALQEKFASKFAYISDGGRAVIMKEAPEGVENISTEKRKNIQKGIFEYYAERENTFLENAHDLLAISDASMIEVAAYSDGLLLPNELSEIHTYIEENAGAYCVLKLPIGVTPLSEDGIRDESLHFQKLVDDRINAIIEKFQLPNVVHLPRELTSLEERVEFVEGVLKNLEG